MPTPITDTRRLFEYAAHLIPDRAVQLTVNLQLLDAQKLFPDVALPEFVDWKQLKRVLPDLFEIYWTPFTESRRRRLEAIADWSLGPGLCDRLAEALVEPFFEMFRGPHARPFLLLSHLHIHCRVPVTSDHYVLPTAMDRLEAANDPGTLPRNFKTVLSRANHTSHHCYLMEMTNPTLTGAGNWPAWQLEERHASVRVLVRGVLGALLDPSLPKRGDPVPE